MRKPCKLRRATHSVNNNTAAIITISRATRTMSPKRDLLRGWTRGPGDLLARGPRNKWFEFKLLDFAWERDFWQSSRVIDVNDNINAFGDSRSSLSEAPRLPKTNDCTLYQHHSLLWWSALINKGAKRKICNGKRHVSIDSITLPLSLDLVGLISR